ncbi:DNA polymerase III subunit alpha [Candidatus Nomurabacteria bacterium]|nr:DNA polymerase III subunit alpha [Candidatus Nomurabacteria bacterium]
MSKSFTHLHVHSHYSLLNALPKISEIIDRAKKEKMKAVALTDNCNLYGAIEFYQKCLSSDIKPIIGIDAFVAPRTRKDKEPRIDSRSTRLILLAKNRKGFGNIIQLITDAHLEGFYYRPRIDKETIAKWKDNLICISPDFNGEISNAIKIGDIEKAKEITDFYKKNYGEENFFLEITHHPEIEGHVDLVEKIKKFAKETSTNLVAAHNVFYINSDDKDARKTLMSVQQSFGGGSSYAEEDENFSFVSTKDIYEYFADVPEAIENTQTITEMCNLNIDIGKWKFPDYKIESGRTPDEELKFLTYEGLKYREMELTNAVKERIEYELGVIKDKGYATYFLTVSDLLKYAKQNKIQTNTRGSAAGSLVSFLTGITTVDPIEFRLPFERFLNPERPSAPDIDMDLADDKRDDLIEYTRQKYGRDHVAQIGTFGTMLARGSVRDTARAMGFDYSKGDQIAKLIPMGAQGFPMTITRAMKEVPELTELYKIDEDTKTIIDMAKKIEGCARHIGVHAAGVVISPDPLTDDVPLQYDPKGEGKLITQYDMHAVGEDGVGLLKFDFLGLKNLTIIANTIKLIEKLLGEEIDVEKITNDDTKTYEMLARGETAATFQLNGSGMTKFLKDLKPTNIHDINAMVALYRPGPMAFIPDYIERKHNPEKVSYLDPKLKDFLEPTFGILIYQDDILLIAVHLAGYTWGEADKFRKAVGKKIPEEMAKQKAKFIDGCVEVGGFDRKKAQQLWEMIETFAAYGFNKAHAASYGRVAYLTSYFKANYPILYMASVLSSESGDVEKVAEMITECKRMNIPVLAPDINESFADFTVVNNESIRFGLVTIKNFGQGIADVIIAERKKSGKFTSLENFLTRVTDKNLNKKSLEALIKSGALDSFDIDRGQLLENLEDLLQFNKEISKGSQNQASLFGENNELPSLKLKESKLITTQEKLNWEKELLGLYISGNPLDPFKKKLSEHSLPIHLAKDEKKNNLSVLIGGIVEKSRIIRTKKGDEMAFVTISDLEDSIEGVMFPLVLQKYRELIEPGTCLVVGGKVSFRNGEPSILVDKAKRLEDKR